MRGDTPHAKNKVSPLVPRKGGNALLKTGLVEKPLFQGKKKCEKNKRKNEKLRSRKNKACRPEKKCASTKGPAPTGEEKLFSHPGGGGSKYRAGNVRFPIPKIEAGGQRREGGN